MKILIVGSTGATGRLLVNQLLSKGHEVKAFARSNKNFTDETISNKNLEFHIWLQLCTLELFKFQKCLKLQKIYCLLYC